ncbi:carboxylesterase/lipase family protein [Streptosporangium sp. NPDC002721]|uniref:carboxylesterase/lipase family protein n=1 Tax=Streptosporangium sp. NPDC002721 TaxID=3366188 RepID=UPI00369E9736
MRRPRNTTGAALVAGLAGALLLATASPATAQRETAQARQAAPVATSPASPTPLTSPASPASSAAGDRDVTVRTDAGWVKGVRAGGNRLFHGIPYAAPPVGELRWRSPQAVTPWQGVRDAGTPGSRCAQTADNWGLPGSEAEDCLYLDVTTPARSAGNRPRPVMVWLHGGGLMRGAGSDYDARRLAERGDVVVVKVNYRLGIFGFFGHPGLENAGAFGIEDQQAALRWVRRNAAAFGGDPRNVTLAGESAGSHSVCAQLASPSAAGLFHRAITQSSPCGAGSFEGTPLKPVLKVPLWLPKASHEGYGQYFATLVGCADPETALACLYGKPVAELLAQDPLPLPGYGNAVLPEDPAKVLQEGRFHRVPVLTGITRDEGTLFAPALFEEPLTAEDYEREVNDEFGAAGPEVLARYPVGTHDGPPLQAVAAIMSDLDWAWVARDTDLLLARYVPTYSYEFTDRTAPPLFPLAHGVKPLAAHGSELSFLFGVGWESAPLTAEQRRLGDRMIDYWTAFAATGDPNRPGLPAWKRVRPGDGTPYVQGLAPGRGGVGPFDRASAHNLAFWDGLATRGTEAASSS